jgi:hypothetical protein
VLKGLSIQISPSGNKALTLGFISPDSELTGRAVSMAFEARAHRFKLIRTLGFDFVGGVENKTMCRQINSDGD